MNEETRQPTAEELLKSTARNVSELATLATHQIEDGLQKTRERLVQMQSALTQKTRLCARETGAYVHQHPWNAIAIAAGLGFVLGLLLRRD